MNHPSNEVKQLVARAGGLLAREGVLDVRAAPAAEALKALLPALVNGTKEKNTYVRANSELALRAILRLPHEDEFCQVRIWPPPRPRAAAALTGSPARLPQQCLGLLEAGAREALSDVVARVLRRAHPDSRMEDLDCTLIC